MFSNCYALREVLVPEAVTTIASGTFEVCTSLQFVYIPKNVTSIGEAAFDRCPSLVSLVIPFIGSQRGNTGSKEANFGWIFGSTAFDNVDGSAVNPTTQYYTSSATFTVYIPQTLKNVYVTDETIVGYGAFSNCKYIERLLINHEYEFTTSSALETGHTEALVNQYTYIDYFEFEDSVYSIDWMKNDTWSFVATSFNAYFHVNTIPEEVKNRIKF